MNDAVFLSYAREDIEMARRLHTDLTKRGLSVWFDETSLRAGSRWKAEIPRAIRASRYFCALLSSNAVSKRGYVQAEIREGLEVLKQFPEDEIYLLPIRLEPCDPSNAALVELNWTDMFPEWDQGLQRLLAVLLPVRLRFDGYYISHGPRVSRAYRFGPDGSVASDFEGRKGSEPEPVFDKNNWRPASRGKYKLNGKHLAFTTVNSAGEVDYVGEVRQDSLVLRFHSRINNNRGIVEVTFRSGTV